MNPTVLLVGLGLGAGALYLVMRSSAPTRTVSYTTASGATVTVQVPTSTTAGSSAVTSTIAQQRELMIQRIMTQDHLTRAQAEARYDQTMPRIAAALTSGTPVSGLGSYVRA